MSSITGSGGGTPGGSTTQIQFNDGGAFGGDAGLTYDKTTDALTVGGGLVLTGGQIAFPATAVPSSNANTLDDYEEGTFTPIFGGTGGQSGQTYLRQSGAYIKVGRLVTVWIDVALTTKGTMTGDCVISGLPFLIDMSAMGTVNWGLNAAYVYVYLYANPGELQCYVRGATGAATTTNVPIPTSATTNGSFLFGTLTYRTSV